MTTIPRADQDDTIVTLYDRLWAVLPTIRYVKAQAAAERVLAEQKPAYERALRRQREAREMRAEDVRSANDVERCDPQCDGDHDGGW